MRLDYRYLYDIAGKLQDEFRNNKPFPHVVIPNFIEESQYNFVCHSFPSPDSPIWKKPSNEHTLGKMVPKQGSLKIKEALFTENQRRILCEFNGGLFLKFLSILSGIDNLVSDPYLAEGGFHCSKDGGYLDIHADFSHSDKTGLERRLNLIYFVNEDWKQEYGGALCLYDKELNEVVRVEPRGNTAVIFETSDHSFHGHPTPMKLPKGVHRKSIALYYYSIPRPERERKEIIFPKDPDFKHKPTTE